MKQTSEWKFAILPSVCFCFNMFAVAFIAAEFSSVRFIWVAQGLCPSTGCGPHGSMYFFLANWVDSGTASAIGNVRLSRPDPARSNCQLDDIERKIALRSSVFWLTFVSAFCAAYNRIHAVVYWDTLRTTAYLIQCQCQFIQSIQR